MASEAIAAGLGALTTCRIPGPSTKAKSSNSAPSDDSAWVRTPAEPGPVPSRQYIQIWNFRLSNEGKKDKIYLQS
jgi:hypothetical protein